MRAEPAYAKNGGGHRPAPRGTTKSAVESTKSFRPVSFAGEMFDPTMRTTIRLPNQRVPRAEFYHHSLARPKISGQFDDARRKYEAASCNSPIVAIGVQCMVDNIPAAGRVGASGPAGVAALTNCSLDASGACGKFRRVG